MAPVALGEADRTLLSVAKPTRWARWASEQSTGLSVTGGDLIGLGEADRPIGLGDADRCQDIGSRRSFLPPRVFSLLLSFSSCDFFVLPPIYTTNQ